MNGKKGGNPRVSNDEFDVMRKMGSSQDVKLNSNSDMNLTLEKEAIVGGKADGKTTKDIAEKHGVSVEHIEDQLKKGLKIEREHSKDMKKRREISLDHLWEDPDYYDYLEDMEKQF